MAITRELQILHLVRQLRSLYRTLYTTRPTDCGPAADSPPLTRAQAELLAAVARRPEGRPAGELAAELGVSSGAITQLADALVAKGVLVRRANPADRRSVLLMPARPQPATDGFEAAYAAHVAPLFEDLSAAELAQLSTMIERIRNQKEA